MLETELKKLTAAIYELNATLEAMGDLPVPTNADAEDEEPKHSGKSVKDVVDEAVSKKAEPEPETETEIEEVNASAHTADSVRKMALAVSRKDRSKQRDMKAKLAEYNAKLATDLKGDELQAFGDWLQALKEEIGA